MLNERALEINNKSFLHPKARSFYRYKVYYAVVKRFSFYALKVAEIETSPTVYYVQLLRLQILKAQKRLDCIFLRFWDLRT